jgi:tetratricopeptide (TPR) repeat protein
MPHDIFISHSHEDKLTADAVCAILEKNGIRCWIAPRDVVPGMDYSDQLTQAIEDCRAMVIVFSSNSNGSNQVKAEIDSAFGGNKILIPLRIEEIEPTRGMAHYLRTVHWLDAYAPPLELHLQRLADTLLRMMPDRGQPKEPATFAPPPMALPPRFPPVKETPVPTPAAAMSPPVIAAPPRVFSAPPRASVEPPSAKKVSKFGSPILWWVLGATALILVVAVAGMLVWSSQKKAAAARQQELAEEAQQEADAAFSSAKDEYTHGDFDSVVDDCSEAITGNSSFVEAYALRGAAKTGKDDYDGAIADCTQAISLDAKYALAYAYRGDAESEKLDFAAALADCNQAIALDPNCAPAYATRGYLEANYEDDEAAMADCNKAVALDNSDAKAYFYRAELGSGADSLSDYSEAITLNPGVAYFYTARGAARDKDGKPLEANPTTDIDKAISMFDEEIAADPKYAEAYDYRGNAKDDKGDQDGALADFNQAIALNPGASYYYTDRAAAEMDKKNFNAALADCDKAISLNPTMPEFYDQRADIRDITGDKTGAAADKAKVDELQSEETRSLAAAKATAANAPADDSNQTSPEQAQIKAVTNNLRQLTSAAQVYMLDKGVTEARYQDIVGTGTDDYIQSVTPVMGEDYTDFQMAESQTQVSVKTSDGTVVTFTN